MTAWQNCVAMFVTLLLIVGCASNPIDDDIPRTGGERIIVEVHQNRLDRSPGDSGGGSGQVEPLYRDVRDRHLMTVLRQPDRVSPAATTDVQYLRLRL